ncbi:MAG: DNA cytosine methyltransferase [Fimbriimonadaceae bacterium]|nr:DNA cytosine methyltransferase [Fimbriimonadaceae bacterium]
MGKHLIGIDLCCGVGGMSAGFRDAGFDVRAAVDNDPINVDYHHRNFPECEAIREDLECLSAVELRSLAKLGRKEIHVVFGGPPCQGFSLMGKRSLDDPRSSILLEFGRLATELNPNYIVAENVTGLLVGATRSFYDALRKLLEAENYEVLDPWVIDAVDYGVPQSRRRVIIVAKRGGMPVPEKPKPIGATECITVRDAIGDLELIDADSIVGDRYAGELGFPSEYAKQLREGRDSSSDPLTCCAFPTHSDAVIKRFEATKAGEFEAISRFKRLAWDSVSNTLRAGTGRDKGSFMAARPIHPSQPRCITVREAARLHSFEDAHEFHPTHWHGFRQVGNAVPPILAKVVAVALEDITSK